MWQVSHLRHMYFRILFQFKYTGKCGKSLECRDIFHIFPDTLYKNMVRFLEYLQVVADDLALYSRECVDTVKTAFTRLEELVDNPGDENITALFNLCDDIEEVNTESDIANFLEKITDDVFAYVAQYNKISGLTTSVDDLCDILTNETYGDEIHRLAEVNKLFYGSTCLDYKYQNTVDYLRDVTITPSGNSK